MNSSTVGRFAVFVLLATGLTAGWWYVEKTFFPKPPPKEPEPSREVALALTGGVASPTEPANKWRTFFMPETPRPEPAKEEPAKTDPAKVEPPKPSTPSEPFQFLTLGGEGFYEKVLLTSKGAAVQQVILPKFDESNREGRDAKDPETGKSRPLFLIPGFKRPRDATSIRTEAPYENLQAGPVTPSITLAEPSYTLMHYPAPGDPERLPDDQNPDRFCSRELSNRTWKVIENVPGTVDTEARIVFETEVGAPYFLKLRKTFTLKAGDYHIGMKLDFEALPGRQTGTPFKYQICGARGLPIEGEWYTSTFRNAIVGWTTPYAVAKRDIQESATVSIGHGGYDVKSEGNNTFGYAGVANQFFASVLCIDETQPEEFRRKMWDYARPTREPHGWDEPGKDNLVDMTVRVASKPIDPAAGKPVSHSYLIYNGPTKVRLLWQMQGDRAVEEGLVKRYHDDLHLNTLTDHHSQSWIGRFSSAIYWGDLITWLTNRMHGILGFLHGIVPVWGVDILLLTFLVRLALFYPSRRQQATMKKMQDKMAQLQPEINKLKEKYKDDPQTFNREKTRLMFQNGANPLSSLGGCFIMIFQIPIFMGLYLCLQESVFFRLESFLWIPNLAAPDMLAWWSEKIPFIADLKNLGEPYYLGPFFNILPLIAVALMMIHQKMTMPPPVDEQAEMQQRMMKIMMLVMAVFFYKMAAGVCLYFIVSTAWGLAERKLLPKPKEEPTGPIVTSGNSGGGKPPEPQPPAGPPGFFGKLKARVEELQKQSDQQRQIRTDYKPGTSPQGKPKKKRK